MVRELGNRTWWAKPSTNEAEQDPVPLKPPLETGGRDRPSNHKTYVTRAGHSTYVRPVPNGMSRPTSTSTARAGAPVSAGTRNRKRKKNYG